MIEVLGFSCTRGANCGRPHYGPRLTWRGMLAKLAVRKSLAKLAKLAKLMMGNPWKI